MLVTGSDYFSWGVHEPELAAGNGFHEILKHVNMTFAQYKVKIASEMPVPHSLGKYF